MQTVEIIKEGEMRVVFQIEDKELEAFNNASHPAAKHVQFIQVKNLRIFFHCAVILEEVERHT